MRSWDPGRSLMAMPPRAVAVDGDGNIWPRSSGVVSALVGTTLVVVGLAQFPITPTHLVGAVVVAALLWADVVRFLPRWLLGPLVCAGAVAVGGRGDDVALFLVVLATGEVATTGSLFDTLVTVGVAYAALLARALTATQGINNFGPWGLGVLLAASGGSAIRGLMRLNTQLREAQTTVASQAAADERRRLAREIHDVIAHSMTVTMLHVTAARLALQDDPPSVGDAVDALAEAETQGRRSLADIRGTVGLLTTDDPAESSLAPPVPGIDELPDLIDSFAAAGLAIERDVQGDLRRVSPATGVAIYRVVQEGLANAARHAPGARVKVSIHALRHTVCIFVENGAATAAPTAAGGGRGVVGMTERVRQLGGRLSAGPAGDGWQVRADLPSVPARGRCP